MEITVRFSTLCLKCFNPIPHKPEDDPLGSMDCTDCPHCGDHACGARQMQLGKPCTKAPPLLKKTAFACVRRESDSGREWLDSQSIQPLRECVDAYNRELKTKIPSWDKANPVVRIVRVEITELPD